MNCCGLKITRIGFPDPKKTVLKKISIILFLAFGAYLQAQTVKIAAAANLRYVLEEIKTNYSGLNPQVNISLNFGSSGTLFQQISNGAEYDIFMAADKIYPEKLKALGMVTCDVKTYAYGKLVLWSNTVDVSKGLEILTDKSVVRIAMANPELAPYGERSLQCLKYYSLYEKLKGKIVYADNIAQAAQYARTGNAEAAFIALALAMSPEMKGTSFVLDTKSYKPVEQAMVLMKSRQSNPEALKFMNFVLSAECKPVFEKYGYIVP
jgi:molybdate transport system substrate-binding protein